MIARVALSAARFTDKKRRRCGGSAPLRRRGRYARAAAIALTLLLLASCRGQDVQVDYLVVSGTFERIDLNAGVGRFRFLHQKSGEYRTEDGRLGPETEVMINGRLSELSDIQLGETAVVVWRVRKSGGSRRIDALKIRIVRDEARPTT